MKIKEIIRESDDVVEQDYDKQIISALNRVKKIINHRVQTNSYDIGKKFAETFRRNSKHGAAIEKAVQTVFARDNSILFSQLIDVLSNELNFVKRCLNHDGKITVVSLEYENVLERWVNKNFKQNKSFMTFFQRQKHVSLFHDIDETTAIMVLYELEKLTLEIIIQLLMIELK